MLYLLLDNTREWLVDNGLYWALRLLDQVQFRALASAGLSFLFVLLMGRRTIRWLVRMKIGDSGSTDAEALRAHAAAKSNTPTMGGLLICSAILVSTGLLADVSSFYVQLGLLVLLWLSVLGGFDDWLKLTASRRGTGRQGLLAWEKFVFQIGLGLLVGFFVYREGRVLIDGVPVRGLAHVLNLPGQRTYEPATGAAAEGLIYLSQGIFVIVAMLLIAGISNAVNITDGMDGLATGSSATVSFSLLVLALIAGSESFSQALLVPYIPGTEELAVLAGAMAGACVGFLWWNCSPAQVFMGDTGSLPLGGLMAYIAIVTRQEVILLILCGVFLLEIGSVIIQVGYFKISGGKRVFRCAPFHHHLHLGGWTEQQVVARAWIVSVILAVLGLALLKVR